MIFVTKILSRMLLLCLIYGVLLKWIYSPLTDGKDILLTSTRIRKRSQWEIFFEVLANKIKMYIYTYFVHIFSKGGLRAMQTAAQRVDIRLSKKKKNKGEEQNKAQAFSCT